MRIARFLLFGISTLFLGAAPVAAAVPIKSCDLISAQTAATIFGGPTSSGTEQNIAMVGGQCLFETASGGEVSLGLMDKTNMAALHTKPQDMPAILNQPQPGQHNETIPGLGEWNVLMAAPGDTSLYVIKDGYLVSLHALQSTNPGAKNALIQGARLALAKL